MFIATCRYWKKQLMVARDARRVDILCHRISLSYRLLDGTLQFKELHNIVEDAKAKLETEVGPVNGVSARMARGLVSRLPVSRDVQKLCSLGIEKAEEWLNSACYSVTKQRGISLGLYCISHVLIDNLCHLSSKNVTFSLQIHFPLLVGSNLRT